MSLALESSATALPLATVPSAGPTLFTNNNGGHNNAIVGDSQNVVLPLRRSSSAFARSSSTSPNPHFFVLSSTSGTMVAGAGSTTSSAFLPPSLDMAICGVPPPVGVKKERVPVIISAAPQPPRTSRATPKKQPDVSPYLGSSPKKKRSASLSHMAISSNSGPLQTSTSADGLAPDDEGDDDGARLAEDNAAAAAAAGGERGPQFSASEPTQGVAKKVRRVRSQSVQPASSSSLAASCHTTTTQSGDPAPSSMAKSMTLRPRESTRPTTKPLSMESKSQPPPRSRSMTQLGSRTLQPADQSALATARRQASVAAESNNNPHSSSSGSGAAAALALRKVSRSDPDAALVATTKSTTTLSSSLKSAPAPQGPPAIKKYIVEANAYHCTFVQSMMMSRGPEWKATCRTATTITANDIAQCAFVWFKFEHMKSIPYVERVRVPAALAELLRTRYEEMQNLMNPGVAFPDRSNRPQMAALDLLNAVLIPEEAETPANSGPLVNIARKRMPNMILCEKSNAHALAPPPGTDPEVAKLFDQYKSLLHYHHLKFVKGTPIIACFKEASAVWRKHLLYRYMKQYCDNDPERRGSVRERCPASFEFDLNRPEEEVRADALLFMNTMMSEHGVVRWLAKATGGANGNGFYVTKDPEDMVRYVSGQTKKAGGESDFWIIQEFVERMPLLFDGHRFHMKVHVVMIATAVGLDFYAYKKQRIQCCSEQFNPDVMHPLSYIGNWGQQRFATNLVQEKFSTLLEDIKGEYPQLLPAWHRAKLLIAEAVEAAWRCGRQHFDFTPGCYELMGWDFVMEECPDGIWRPLLVEANHRPGFGSERKYMEKLIHEVLELVMYPVNGLTKHHKEVHNGVVEAIWDHVKTIVIHPLSTEPAPPTTAGGEDGASGSTATA